MAWLGLVSRRFTHWSILMNCPRTYLLVRLEISPEHHLADHRADIFFSLTQMHQLMPLLPPSLPRSTVMLQALRPSTNIHPAVCDTWTQWSTSGSWTIWTPSRSNRKSLRYAAPLPESSDASSSHFSLYTLMPKLKEECNAKISRGRIKPTLRASSFASTLQIRYPSSTTSHLNESSP